MSHLVSYYSQIEPNLRRTASKGLISLLNHQQLEDLAFKYFGIKDESGNGNKETDLLIYNVLVKSDNEVKRYKYNSDGNEKHQKNEKESSRHRNHKIR